PLIIQPVRDALEYYRRLNEAAQASRHRKSADVGLNVVPGSPGPIVVPPPSSCTSCSTVAITTSGPGSNNGNLSATPSTIPTSSSCTVPSLQQSSSTSTVPSLQHTTNLCDNKIPSDPCNMNRDSRSGSVSMPNSNFNNSDACMDATCSSPTSRNPITIAHRRASQLLVRGSGSVTSLKSAITIRSGGPGHFTSFPSLESDSEREGGDSEEDDDAITEVAVSEKALKFKIATESSFDHSSTSRKSSRENKSESSGQSGSINSQTTSGNTRDMVSLETSMVSLIPSTAILAHAPVLP
ncbi:unnamed protein product, partial [Allacma fusca]